MPSAEDIEARLRLAVDRNDDYLQTVWALCAFAHALCYDEAAGRRRPGTHICIPRKMNPAGGGDTLTPDAVVQWMPDKGIIVEAKKHISDDAALEYLDQVKTYDQELEGWWTADGQTTKHDVVMLTHLFSSAKAQDAYRLWEQNGGRFDRSFAIVQFTRTSTGIAVTHLVKVAGELSDRTLDQGLHDGVKFPESVALTLFANHKLMDARPPLELLIELLVTHVLPALGQPDQSDDSGIFRTEFDTTVDSVQRKSQEVLRDPEWHSDGRGFQLPKKEWVRDALDGLVRMKLAAVTSPNRYHVKLPKSRKGDLMRFIVTRLLKASKEADEPDPEQLPLEGLDTTEPRGQ